MFDMRNSAAVALVVVAGVIVEGCAPRPERPTRAEIEAAVEARTVRALDRGLDRITAMADSIDEIFHPLPLLTASTEAALRRHSNQAHVARARTLGIPRGAAASELEALVRDGRLVALEDSTTYWVVRELDHSTPLVVPDVRAFLVRLGERFHAGLADLGAPAFRFEISSVLRTAADQTALRGTNPNAARGVSAHEFGTTLDVAYDGVAAPAPGPDPAAAGTHGMRSSTPWLEAHLGRVEIGLLERVAARRSRELQAIFAETLREMQAAGDVLVTLERRQPVYHLTVARRFESTGR